MVVMIQDGCGRVMQMYCYLPEPSHHLYWVANPDMGVMNQPTAGGGTGKEQEVDPCPFPPPPTQQPCLVLHPNYLPTPGYFPSHSQVPNHISPMLSPGTSPMGGLATLRSQAFMTDGCSLSSGVSSQHPICMHSFSAKLSL